MIEIEGTFYGTTTRGGTYDTVSGGAGTVFGMTRDGKERVLHSFGSGHDGSLPSSSLSWIEANLYGTTYEGGAYGRNGGSGTAFSVNSTTEQVLYNFAKHSGRHPSGRLIGVNGTLYGTTERGGKYDGGTVFSLSTSGVEQVLHSFGSGSDGKLPYAGVVDVGGTLYGTTKEGGAYNEGTVFALSP